VGGMIYEMDEAGAARVAAYFKGSAANTCRDAIRGRRSQPTRSAFSAKAREQERQADRSPSMCRRGIMREAARLAAAFRTRGRLERPRRPMRSQSLSDSRHDAGRADHPAGSSTTQGCSSGVRTRPECTAVPGQRRQDPQLPARRQPQRGQRRRAGSHRLGAVLPESQRALAPARALSSSAPSRATLDESHVHSAAVSRDYEEVERTAVQAPRRQGTRGSSARSSLT
jgi:hypothetical protein